MVSWKVFFFWQWWESRCKRRPTSEHSINSMWKECSKNRFDFGIIILIKPRKQFTVLIKVNPLQNDCRPSDFYFRYSSTQPWHTQVLLDLSFSNVAGIFARSELLQLGASWTAGMAGTKWGVEGNHELRQKGTLTTFNFRVKNAKFWNQAWRWVRRPKESLGAGGSPPGFESSGLLSSGKFRTGVGMTSGEMRIQNPKTTM